MTKENLIKLFSFKTLYLALLTFVILHLILLAFGLSFTPVLWNSWFFILCLTLFINPWIVFCYKATEFSGQIHSTEEGEISWVDKDVLSKLDLAYDMLELLRMMEDEELSEYYYHERIEDGWRKSMY